MSETPFDGVFVTGTDTGVGKTVVSAGLLMALRPHRLVRYWKPIQTGIEQDDDRLAVQTLSGASSREIFSAGVRLPQPLSPHLAAKLAGTAIHLDDLLTLASAQPRGEFWIVEGAGGALVPLNDRQLMSDLMVALALPVVVVARSGLGTINHTLLTLEALRGRGLQVAGVMMVGNPNRDNRDAIERYGGVAVIGELPPLDPMNAESLNRAAAGWSLDEVVRLKSGTTTNSRFASSEPGTGGTRP